MTIPTGSIPRPLRLLEATTDTDGADRRAFVGVPFVGVPFVGVPFVGVAFIGVVSPGAG